MIVPIESSQNRDEFVVCPDTSITVPELRERMLRRAKVTEGSYAFRLIDDIHSAMFLQSLDLRADYEAYFALEYASFGEYLRRRLRFPAAVVAKLTKAIDVSSGMYYFRPGYAFLADDYGLDFLTLLVEDSPVEETP